MNATKKYKVTVYERLRTDVLVEASSEEEAINIAEEAYLRGEIVLGDRDYDGPEFAIMNEISEDDSQYLLEFS